MADRGIFLDVLPRFDMAAAALMIGKVQSLFKKAGVESSAAFGKGAQEGLRVLQAEMIRTENVASNMYIKMRKAAGDHQVAEARINELRAKNVEETSARMIAAQNRVDIARAKSLQLAKEQAAAQAAVLDAQAAVAAKQASITEAAAVTGSRMNTFGMVATGALALIGAKSVDAAGKYEASLTKIQSTTGESADAIKKLGDGLLQLGPQVGYSAQELQNAAFLLAKSRVGFNDANAQLGVLKAAAQLAKVEGADLTDVMNGLTTTMVDFHVPASKAADVASQLRVTVGAAKAPLDQFMGALHNFEPIMKVITNGGGDAASSIGQVGAMLAQMTQNGMSADQASQNLRNTLLHLIDPSGPQRNIMGQLGLTPDDLSKQLSDPEKGPIGVMKIISDRIAEMAGDSNHVVLDALYKNPQATENMNKAFSLLSGQSLAFAQSINNGVMPPMKDLHKQMKLDPELAQWMTMRQKVEGFSDTLKKNQDLVRTIPQIFKNVTGTDQGMMVFSQLFGNAEDANKTIELWHEAAKAKADASGNVEGTELVTETYKFKLDAAKASWHSLTIQMGEAFLPTAKVVMDALAKIAEFLTQHQGIMHGVTTVLELLAGRWLLLKANMVIGPLVSKIAADFGLMLKAASNTYDKITGKAKQSADMSAKAAQESADKQVAASQAATTKQVENQEKVAVSAQTSAEKQAVAAEGAATKAAEASSVSTTKQAEDQTKIAVAGEKANTVIGTQRVVAAETGTVAVDAAATKQVLAEDKVATAAERANVAISRGSGLLSGGAFVGAMMLPGGDQGRDAVNMAATGAAMFAGAPIAIPAVAGAALYDASVANNQKMSDEQNIASQRAIIAAGGHAAGGPIFGSGTKGKDSVLAYLAPGEHVLTADEVDAAGGHGAIYAMRAALRRGMGGPIPLADIEGIYQDGVKRGDDGPGVPGQSRNPYSGIPTPGLQPGEDYRPWGPWTDLQMQPPFRIYGPLDPYIWNRRGVQGFQKGGAVGALDSAGAQVDTIAVAAGIQAAFGIPRERIGFYRSPDGYNEHSSGEAADIMVNGDTALGNAVALFALQNADKFGVKYVLWQQKQWNPDGTGTWMTNRGNATQNHMDHVHIRTEGGGWPPGGGPGGSGTGKLPAGTSNTPSAAAALGFTIGGGGGIGVGGGSGMGGSSGLGGSSGSGEQDYNPFNQLSGGFTLANLAKFATMFLANLALGNPVGRMEAAKRTGGAMSGLPGLAGAEANLPTSLAGIEADQQRMKIENARTNAATAISKYGEGSPQAQKAVNAYRTALENAEKTQIKANDNVGKYGTKLEELNAKLDQQKDHLTEQQGSGAKPSAIEATQNAITRTQNQIDTTIGKIASNAAKLPAAASPGVIGNQDYYDSQVNGEVPHWEDWGYTGGGGLGPVFKRGGGGGGVPDIAPPDRPDKDKVLPMSHGHTAILGDAPATAIQRGTFDALKDWPKTGPMPTPGVGQGVDPVGAARQGKPVPTVGGGGSFLPGPIGDAAWAGQNLTAAANGGGLPAVPRGMKPGVGLPGGAPQNVQDAYKQAQINALRGAFAPPTGMSAYNAGKAPAPASLPPSPGPAPAGGGIGMGPGLPAPPPASMSRPAAGGTGSGFGVSGGLLGTAEGAASMAAAAGVSAMAPGAGAAAGAAADIMTKEANRFIGYLGQVAGIGVNGLLETFSLNDSPLADPSKSWFGKIAGGLAGAHPTGPNSAGATVPPLQKQEDPAATMNQTGTFGDMNITNNFHGTNDNADQVNREQNRAMLMYGGGAAGQ